MSEDVKTIFREVYDIPTPTAIAIGDPFYFEQLNDVTTPFDEMRKLRKLVLVKEKIPTSRKARLVFEKLDVEGWTVYSAQLIVTNRQFLDTYSNNQYYPDMVKAEYQLGCDTAKYEIAVEYKDDVRNDVIHTGADGYYGSVMENKGTYGFTATFDMPDDLMSESEMRNTLSYMFKCDEIKNKEAVV